MSFGMSIKFAVPALAAVLMTFGGTGTVRAQSSIDLIIGSDAGGGYDVYGRTVARHIVKYLPGNPTIVPRNMPGAGGNRAAEFAYNQAPKDGSAFAIIFPGSVMTPLVDPTSGLKFDPSKFNYIGTAAKETRVCMLRKEAKAKTFADTLKEETVIAASAEGGSTADYALLMNDVLGTKFKIVRGYKGTREMLLAVERGEADGLCGYAYSSLKTQKPEWSDGVHANLIVQFGIDTDPDLDKLKVPSIFNFTKTEADKQVFELLVGQQEFGRPFVMPPGVPADKVKAMREAFAKVFKDPEFLAEGKKQKLDIGYGSGEEVQKLVDRLYATPKPVVDRMIKAMAAK
jgi:tripartite-type tricarboxylate transporter receptor subunit TctC